MQSHWFDSSRKNTSCLSGGCGNTLEEVTRFAFVSSLVCSNKPQLHSQSISVDARDRLLRYSHRVRYIAFDGDGSISLDVIKILGSLGSPTLSNLVRVYCHTSSSHILSTFERLWSVPSLRSLVIRCDSPIALNIFVLLGEIMRRAPQTMPDLNNFRITNLGSISQRLDLSFLGPILAGSLPRLLRLETISIAGLGCAPYILPLVSSLPDLCFLFLDFEKAVQEVSIFTPASFPKLGSLDLSACIEMCTNVITSLRRISSLSIWCLCLTLSGREEELVGMLALAQSIKDVLGPTLSKLTISSPDPLDTRILQSLFECHQLESVQIAIAYDSEEHKADLVAQAERAWPELHELNFDFEGEYWL